jgi:hypothetical protein
MTGRLMNVKGGDAGCWAPRGAGPSIRGRAIGGRNRPALCLASNREETFAAPGCPITIRRLHAGDADAYRVICLEDPRDDPMAFDATFDQEAGLLRAWFAGAGPVRSRSSGR